MASARQKNGKWYYRVTVSCGPNSHKYIERGSYRTKREALEAGTRAELAIKDGEFADRRNSMSFNFLAEEWLEDCKNKYRDNTLYRYRIYTKNFILPILGDYDLTAINYRLCQKVIDECVATYHTRSRLANLKGCMNQCFKYAVRCGYLQQNPARDVTLPAPRSRAAQRLKPSRHVGVIPKDEIEAIFKRYPEGHPSFLPLYLGYRCGMRLGEAFGLAAEDVDFNEGMIHIRRQVQLDPTNNGHYFTEPKYCLPGQGRDIVMDSETARVLQRHINKLLRLQSPLNFPIYYIGDDGYLNTESGRMIFLLNVRYSDGTYVSPRTMRRVSRIIHGKEGGIRCRFSHVDENFEFHALRHTHASECIAAGMSPTSVQKRLGHKNLQTTYRYYIHETEDQASESRDILEKMFA